MALALERVLVSPKCFGLVEATPMQRVCCRILDGSRFEDLVADHPELAEHLDRTCGPGGLARLPTTQAREVYLLSGIRTAKSLILAAVAFRAAMTVDLSMLRPWERAAVSLLSLTKDKALVVMAHLIGPLMAHPHLRALLPRPPTASTVWIRRPHDGRVIVVRVAAGARAGGSLVGEWSAGALFDEFPRMTGEEEGSVINFDESRKAVLGRLLPGAQLVGVGSPWAPRGAAFEIVKRHWGSPSARIVVLRPPARAMNPTYWTDEVIEELRKSPKGEHIYKTDYLGEFADPESSFFTTAELEAVVRKVPLHAPRDKTAQYFAVMDPAVRVNAWTLVIGARVFRPDGSFRIVVAYARQWVPRRTPIVPEVVLKEIKAECARYGVTEVHTDQWSGDAIAALGRTMGLAVTVHTLTTADTVRIFDGLRMRVLGGPEQIELHGDLFLLGDLLAVRKVVTNQSVRIALPITSDGRHTDYAPPVALLCELASSSPSWIHAMERYKSEGLSLERKR